MKVAILLDRLHVNHVDLLVDGDDIRLRAPRGALTPPMLAAVKAHKAELHSHLSATLGQRNPRSPCRDAGFRRRHRPLPVAVTLANQPKRGCQRIPSWAAPVPELMYRQPVTIDHLLPGRLYLLGGRVYRLFGHPRMGFQLRDRIEKPLVVLPIRSDGEIVADIVNRIEQVKKRGKRKRRIVADAARRAAMTGCIIADLRLQLHWGEQWTLKHQIQPQQLPD